MGDFMIDEVTLTMLALNSPLYLAVGALYYKQGRLEKTLENIESHLKVKMSFKK